METIRVTVNLDAFVFEFSREIQEMLDGVYVFMAGADLVTDDVLAQSTILRANLISENSATLEQVKQHGRNWLVKSLLTDCVDTGGRLLDKGRQLCALYRLSEKELIKAEEFDAIKGSQWKDFHKKEFPRKFSTLENDFGLQFALKEHFLSINKARNCIVHRGGRVTQLDINDNNQLTIKWRAIKIVHKESEQGQEKVINSRTQVNKGELLSIKIEDTQRSFGYDSKIELSDTDLSDIASTMFFFARDFANQIEEYGKKLGIHPKVSSEN